MILLYSLVVLILLEALAYAFCRWVGFPSGVIVDRRMPKITPGLVHKFAEHGYDSELGWIRKPNTSKVDIGKLYHIDHRGSRRNPGHEHLPLTVSTYGDSYTFCRECEDHETWQWYLAEQIKGQVLNFGVGNYGLDQALLRLKREYPKNPTPIVIMGIVPETIARIHSVWKHYYEHGNLLGFKPRYILEDDQIRLIPNYINQEDKYYRIDDFIEEVRRHDYFYSLKFQKEALAPPYLFSLLKRPGRVAVILLKLARAGFKRLHLDNKRLDEWIVFLSSSSGARQSARLFSDKSACTLLLKLIEEYDRYGREKGFRPVLAFLPMRDDLVYIRRRGHFYRDFLKKAERYVEVIDLTDLLLQKRNTNRYFVRWHYNAEGNRIVAEEIYRNLSLKEFRT